MPKPKYLRLRRAVIETCLAMKAEGINQGTSGNVSARAGNGFLVTASGVDYQDMQASQVVEVSLSGTYEGPWKPSSEWRMHRDIYAGFDSAGAVVHTHSNYATALSCLRKDIPPFHYMIAVAGGDTLRCADYATFGTEALSTSMMTALQDRRACLLANHGAICFGPTLAKALWLAVEVETLCKQYFLACQAGKPVLLTKKQMAEVTELFKTYGSQDPD